MKILGVHDGHLATACLLIDGQVGAMASEERFNRQKSWGGVPKESINWVLKRAGLKPSDLDFVVLSSICSPIYSWEESELRFYRRIFNILANFLPEKIAGSKLFLGLYVWLESTLQGLKRKNLYKTLEGLGISRNKIKFVEHHSAHAATCYFTAPEQFIRNAPVLLITLDSSGDGISGTISIGDKGKIKRLRSWTSYHSIGEMYSRVTRLLGMKPAEHEYKVMGLAPYAPDFLEKKAYAYFSKYIKLSVDGLSIYNSSGKWGAGFSKKIEKDLSNIRFDAIAAALQRRTEEVIVDLVRNWIKKTGIRYLAVAGGVFMNIKVNMLLNELPEVEDIFFFPSCGDESSCLGGCLAVYAEECGKQNIESVFNPLAGLYWGPEYSNSEIKAELVKFTNSLEFEFFPDIEVKTVDLLAKGKIIARFAGRMEWGSRGLGNRSILADSRDISMIRRINIAIKQRDFWMPFAPSILWNRRNDYLISRRDPVARYMNLGFKATPLAQKDLIAALHQRDLTCRPQIIEESLNFRYYRLLKLWEKATGCGGLLNTSFNLHGEPIVCTPIDAINTLLRSELDYLVMENYLIWRKQK
jgi:carbamoyltransferase